MNRPETIQQGPIQLGDRVRDMVTGIEGIATARTIWLNGCVRIAIEFAKNKPEGIEAARETVDEEQLEILQRGAVIPRRVTRLETGQASSQAPMPPRIGTGGGGRPDAMRQPDTER